MVRYLIFRPIGTIVVAATLVLLGVIVSQFLPLSLLPNIPVPELTIQASYPNTDASQIQQIVSVPIRNQMLQLNHLDDLEAVSNDGQSIIKLKLDYGSDVDLAYLEANEKIDRLMESLPRDLPRPRVIKSGAGDIPVFQINVSYADTNNNFLELSEFCENVIKRRLEQLPEVALVDVTGLAKAEVMIKLDLPTLQYTGLSIQQLTAIIKGKTGELGNVTIKDGPYEYSVSFDAALKNVSDIENLFLRIGQTNPRIVRLGEIAKIIVQEQKVTGSYTFNGKRAVGMAVIKQNDAQLLKLRVTIDELINAFQRDYPGLKFQISQDQTELLDLSIKNLLGSLIAGAVLSFVMILFFMKNKQVVLLIGLVIPVSITITLLGFYLLGISVNIVSLAGLVLGVGEIIDSAIIIIENIEQYYDENRQDSDIRLSEACINGTEEVIRPLMTSVATNSAVFLPLLFLSGIAGAIFYDQAVAVSLALGVSLLVSYTLVPVLYYQLFKNKKQVHKQATRVSIGSERIYNAVFYFAMRRPKMTIIFWASVMMLSFPIFKKIEKEGMPSISRNELETYIYWNEPVSVEESNSRLLKLMEKTKAKTSAVGMFVGEQQFLLNSRLQQSSIEALVVAKVNSTATFYALKNEIEIELKHQYPRATYKSRPALNVFEQLFKTSDAPVRILISDHINERTPGIKSVDSIVENLNKRGYAVQRPPIRERLYLNLREEKLLLYGVQADRLFEAIRIQLNDDNIGVLHSEQQQIPIVLGDYQSFSSISEIIDNTFVNNGNGQSIPIRELVTFAKKNNYASFYLGKVGTYIPLEPRIEYNIAHHDEILRDLFANSKTFLVQLTGNYYRNLEYIEDLTGIMIIAIGMLFFILAAQFESLYQPFIVLLTILLGITGALICLYLTGNSLNIMSAIGLIVLMGLLDNDSILKIDTMNRFRDKQSLIETIRLGGQKRLQSQLMTFLTTVLGVMPILWSSGLGAELQRPLAISVIGGMILGVLVSWTFIPLTYFWLYSKKSDNYAEESRSKSIL